MNRRAPVFSRRASGAESTDGFHVPGYGRVLGLALVALVGGCAIHHPLRTPRAIHPVDVETMVRLKTGEILPGPARPAAGGRISSRPRTSATTWRVEV